MGSLRKNAGTSDYASNPSALTRLDLKSGWEFSSYSNTIVDSTGYTWTGRGGDHSWTNPVNWRNDQGGDCYGYPQSTAATATFPDLGSPYTVEVPVDLKVKKITLQSPEVTLRGVGATRPKITPSENSTFAKMTLDHVEIYRAADHTLAAGYALLARPFDTLLVHDGTYTNEATMTVTNGWRVVGEHGAGSTWIVVTNHFKSLQVGVSDGAPRIYRDRFVDMGCYQNQKGAGTYLVVK